MDYRFHSRGIGLDQCTCFMCPGSDKKLRDNIAAFVDPDERGQVLELFTDHLGRNSAWVDFRPYEPMRVQIKIGACQRHKVNLEKLHNLTHENGQVINDDILKAVMSAMSSCSLYFG